MLAIMHVLRKLGPKKDVKINIENHLKNIEQFIKQYIRCLIITVFEKIIFVIHYT